MAEYIMRRINILRLPGLAAFTLLVPGPFIWLTAGFAASSAEGYNNWSVLLLPAGRRLDLLLNSFKLSLFVAVSGIILGTLAGSLLWSRNGAKGINFRWPVLLFALLPPYVHVLAWSSLMIKANFLLNLTGLPEINFTGFFAGWWVQLMSLLPVAIGLALIGIESVDPELIEAGRLMRDDIYVLFRIVLPLAAPVILAGGGLLFVLSLVDYSVPSLFQFNVYALEIFAEYSASNEPSIAFLLSWPLLLIAFCVLLLSQRGLKSVFMNSTNSNRFFSKPLDLPLWYRFLQGLAALIFVLQIIVPVFALVMEAGAWRKMISAFTLSFNEIRLTFVISLLAALITLVPAFAAARELLYRGRRAKVWWLLILLPVALPAPLVGIGLVGIWNRPELALISDSVIMPALGAAARFTPFAAIILYACMRRINPLLFDAAQVLQKNSLQTFLKIRLPLLTPGILAAFGIIFILAAGELGATLLLVPPGYETITIKIYNYMHYGASDTVAGLSLLMALTVTGAGTAAMVAWRFGRGWLSD